MGDQWRDRHCNRDRADPNRKNPQIDMADEIKIGDRVQIFLNAKNWGRDEWFSGKVIRIDPYSEHRSFYWVELDNDELITLSSRMKTISVFNPKNIRKI